MALQFVNLKNCQYKGKNINKKFIEKRINNIGISKVILPIKYWEKKRLHLKNIRICIKIF